MAKVLGALCCATAAYAVFATLYVVGAVSSGLRTGKWISATIYVVWLASACLVIGTGLLAFGERHARAVLEASSFTLVTVGLVLIVRTFLDFENLTLAWWLILFPTLLAVACGSGAIALTTSSRSRWR
jgi:hypothetical protein